MNYFNYRRIQIEKLAEEILKDLNPENIVPIDLWAMAKELKGEIKYKQLCEDVSGEVIKIAEEDKEFCIHVNESEYPPRQRFTIGHELGHLFIHMGYMTDSEKWAKQKAYIDSPYRRHGYSVEETEANYFAAAFLMPKELYFEKIQTTMNDERKVDLRIVAQYFNVSVPAALKRGKELGIFPQ
jgi:Predicted Zn peptidase